MSPLLGRSFRVFCVFRGLSNAPRTTEDGWGSRPYLALGQVVRSVARLDEFPLLP